MINIRMVHKDIIVNAIFLCYCFFMLSSCAAHKSNIQKSIDQKESSINFYTAFSGINQLLLLDCETISSNSHDGRFPTEKKEIHMISTGLSNAFQQVPNIQLFNRIQSRLRAEKIMRYNALLSPCIWWQINNKKSSQAPLCWFDLKLQLTLFQKNENNKITSHNMIMTVIQREGMIKNNHLSLSNQINSASSFERISHVMPHLYKKINQINKLLSDTPKDQSELLDSKCQMLLNFNAYKTLKHYLVTSYLAKNEPQAIPLFLDARVLDAIEIVMKRQKLKPKIKHKKFIQKFHPEIYALGQCFENSARIQQALTCYRLVVKYAPKHSRFSAAGIGRCLKIMGIRDHIQMASLSNNPDTDFYLKQVSSENILSENIEIIEATKEADETDETDESEEVSSRAEQIEMFEKKEIQSTPPIETFDPHFVSTATVSEPLINPDVELIHIMLNQWLSAWQSMKPDKYFQFYATTFIPEKKITFSHWKKQRKRRLKRKSILVSIFGEIDITFVSDSEAIAIFVQDYESVEYTYKDRTQKRLLLKKIDGNWRIQKESTISVL